MAKHAIQNQRRRVDEVIGMDGIID
jgi:hypothetical protein